MKNSDQVLNSEQDATRFDACFRRTLVDFIPQLRTKRLLEWESARAFQPQEDRLVRFHMAVRAAQEEFGRVIYHQGEFFDKLTVSSYRFAS